MEIIKATEQDTINIMNMISGCIKSMEAQGIYLFNKAYPSSEIIENDIKNGSGFIFRDNNNCIAYVAIDEDQAPEYSQISWSADGSKVLVIHRLFVHPESQGKGIARRFMDFIEDFAAANKYSCIRLDAYSENAPALRLYERFGYQKLGQVVFPFKDLPFYCYEKALERMAYPFSRSILETARLKFRKIIHDDFDELRKILQDIEVMYAWEHAFSDEEVQNWINENIKRYSCDGYSYFIAIDKLTDEIIGLIGPLVEDINDEKYPGIGYILKKEHWHKGYAFEGAKGCIDYLFNTFKLDKVVATIRPENISSCRVAERLGMKVIGKYYKCVKGKDMEHLIYEIRNEE